MSLNWREIELILQELPLEGSFLQQTIQHDWHSLSWVFFHPQAGRWTLYTEVGTPFSRLHRLTRAMAVSQQQKTTKLQRFIQFLRANVEGSKVVSVEQAPGDRLVRLGLDKGGETMNLYLRFYSGPGANIIITDEENTILDLLYRRPNRNEESGSLFSPAPPQSLEADKFTVRPRNQDSFNQQIEEAYALLSNDQSYQALRLKVEAKRDRQLRELESSIASQLRSLKANENFERFKKTADLLSAYQHLIRDNQKQIELTDWESGESVTIELDPKLKSRQNILLYYEKYQKAKGTYENALTQYELAKKELEERQKYYTLLLDESVDQGVAIKVFRKELASLKTEQEAKPEVGLRLTSGQFTLLVGRNAKENDELLRRYVRGNDWWIHTRDVPGGYVFIKDMKGKSIPLEVLLDAANLAILFSKAKKAGKADLYYTQVKYLRRAKGGPLGLVLPTQEKNLSVTLDEQRVARLLLSDEDA